MPKYNTYVSIFFHFIDVLGVWMNKIRMKNDRRVKGTKYRTLDVNRTKNKTETMMG